MLASEIQRVEYSQEGQNSVDTENIIDKNEVSFLLVRIPRGPTDTGDRIADAVEEVAIFLFGFTRVLVIVDDDDDTQTSLAKVKKDEMYIYIAGSKRFSPSKSWIFDDTDSMRRSRYCQNCTHGPNWK